MLEWRSVATVVYGVGYIGSRLVQDLLYQGRDVVGLDNLFSTDPRAIDGFRRAPTFQFVEGSILDPTSVERALDLAGNVDAVFVLAAQSSARARHFKLFGLPVPSLVRHNPDLADTLGSWRAQVGWVLLGLIGLHAEMPFLRGTLEKLGIEPSFARREQ